MKHLGQSLRTYRIDWTLALANVVMSTFFVTLLLWGLAFSFLPQNLLGIIISIVVAVITLLMWFYLTRASRRTPRLTLHENGIRVHHKDVAKDWLWSELNGLESSQTFAFRLGITYGTVHITSNGVRAFTVDTYTRHNVQLIDFLQLKIAQNLTPDLAKLYTEKDNVNLPPLWISSAGIRINDKLTPWSDMGPLQLKHEGALLGQTQLVTHQPITNKPLKLADLPKGYAYQLLGLLDWRDKTTYLHTEARRLLDVPHTQLSLKPIRRSVVLILVFVVTFVVLQFLPRALTWLRAQQDANARAAFTATFGSVATLCDTADYGTTNLLVPTAPRYLIIDEGTGVEHAFQQALRPERQATSAQDVTTVICVLSTTLEVDSCSFIADEPRNGVEETFYVALVESQYDIHVIDVASGQVVDATSLYGEQLQCPNRVENRLDIFGKPPPADALLQWLKDIGYAT
ncbi:MAG: DUF6585 family protein [Chloroflexota bacterium]|nr:DUF6585 family protein [Chloroflexota bacterium]